MGKTSPGIIAMTIYGWLIAAFWLVLIIVWAVAAGRAKRTVASGWVWRRGIALRLAVLVVVLTVILIFRRALPSLRPYAINQSATAGLVGAVLCALGVGLAVLSRAYLGRNWGMPMSRKAEPELVMSGPYATLRHPIYAGVLLALLGSAIGLSIFWVLPFVVCVPYFIYSARREEQLLTEQFPDQYPAYVKRTKMLLPHLL